MGRPSVGQPEAAEEKTKQKKQATTKHSEKKKRCRHPLRAYRCLGPAVAETQAPVSVNRSSCNSRPVLGRLYRLGVECLDRKVQIIPLDVL